MQRPKFAGDIFGVMLDPTTYTSWSGAIGKRLPLGRLGMPALGLGAGALTGLFAAGSELNNPDPSVSDGERVGGAVGAGGGSMLGTAAGAALGGMTPLGPVGALIGGAIGGSLGGSLGSGAGRGVAGLFAESPEDKAIRDYRKQSAAALDAELRRTTALAPLQQKMAELAIANEVKRAGQMSVIDNLRNSFLQQQASNAAQSLAATQGLMAIPF